MCPEINLKKSETMTGFQTFFSLVQQALVKENLCCRFTNFREIGWVHRAREELA
jgi:hypothetical protein